MFALLVSVSVFGADYNQQPDDFAFDTVLSFSSGKAEFEDSDDDETLRSISVAADFHNYPVEVELRYSNTSTRYVYQFYENDVLIEGIDIDGDLDNWGIAGKLDLSWNCQSACLYLMAGYNYGEYAVDVKVNGEKLGDGVVTGDYLHWGAGFRYDFTNNFRLTVEYLSYDIDEQEEIDFGTAIVWQGGIGYRF